MLNVGIFVPGYLRWPSQHPYLETRYCLLVLNSILFLHAVTGSAARYRGPPEAV